MIGMFRRASAALLLALLPGMAAAADFEPGRYLGTRWYGVYLFEEKVGYGTFSLETAVHRERPAYRTEFLVNYRLNLGGSRQEMSFREEKFYLPGEGLDAFTTHQDSLLGRVAFTGERQGGAFRVKTPTGQRTAEAAGETLADALAHLELVRKEPAPGESVTSSQFETTLLVPVSVTHTVESVEELFPGGVPLKFYRIRSDFPGLGVTTSSLIDGKLRTREGSLGIITIREEEETTARDLDHPGDLILAAAVRPDRKLENPREIRSLHLRLTGIGDPKLILSSRRQEYRPAGEDSYYLKISSPPPGTVPPPPIPILDPARAAELAATAYIQSDHPAIRDLAREIVGEEKDSRRAAGLLTGWVFDNLGKSFLAAIPNAVDVLERGTGDCKAHSVLLVALARSVGLPARTVSGLVAMEDGNFYYHQWAELFTGEWIPADPVFGQIPIDAAHIAFSRSGPAEQLRLLNLIGKIRIEVVDGEWEMGNRE